MLNFLAQAVEPVSLSTGETPVAGPAASSLWMWIVAGAIALSAAAAIVALVLKRGHAPSDPATAAWHELAARLGLTTKRRELIERLAAEVDVPPAALALSQGAMERAVLMRCARLPRAELQAACKLIWPEIEVPGAAGHIPTVAMPEPRTTAIARAPKQNGRPRLHVRA